ncbi:MAG TPA: hypothetical protein DIU15_01140 [Deltaproteobacteria bacterium]|nr:hypothetical protein [Deltaproteobacteria bacterium]
MALRAVLIGLFVVVVGCDPAPSMLRQAQWDVDRGNFDRAISTYENVVLGWPDSEQALEAISGLSSALAAQSVASYESGDHHRTVIAASRLVDQFGETALDQLGPARPGIELTFSYYRSLRAGPTEESRQTMWAVYEQAGLIDEAAAASAQGSEAEAGETTTPESVDSPGDDTTPAADSDEEVPQEALSGGARLRAAAAAWLCEHRRKLPAYRTCSEVDPTVQAEDVGAARTRLSRSRQACQALRELGAVCGEEFQIEIEQLAASNGMSDLANNLAAAEGFRAKKAIPEAKAIVRKLDKLTGECRAAKRRAQAVEDKWGPAVMSGNRRASIEFAIEQRPHNMTVSDNRDAVRALDTEINKADWPDSIKSTAAPDHDLDLPLSLNAAKEACDW